MESKNLYNEGHLFVAAVRVLTHRKGAPPDIEQISELLGFSSEQGGYISRRLREAGIVEQLEGAFGERWAVADHVKLEELPREIDSSQMDQALKKFQAERTKIAQKVEMLKEQRSQKKKDLFAEIEKKLKKNLPKE